MNVLIISSNRNHLPMPVMPIGACMVAEAAERSGHRVTVLDLMFQKHPLRAVELEIERTNPDVIGLSVRNIDNNDMQNPVFFADDVLSLVNIIRKKTGALLVLGGAAVSVMPEELMRFTGISCAVTGDGEVVFPELLKTITRGEEIEKQPGIAWMKDNDFVKNQLPSGSASCSSMTPDFHRWLNTKKYISRLSTVPVQTKLGCHFKCVYCTYRKIEGSTYRFFERGTVIDSIKRLTSSGLRDIEFVDNVFNFPYDHAMGLCEGLAREGKGFRLQSLELNPLFVDDPLIGVMEQAGFRGIGVTVESASDTVLSMLRKGYTSADVYRASEVIQRHRLPCVWIFMLGGPGESDKTIDETLRFAERSIRPEDTAFFNVGVRIYPGTELETIAREQGLLAVPPDEMLPPVFYMSPEMDLSRMIKRIKGSMNTHMNFINSDSIGLSYLPSIHRLGYRLGLKSPLWKYTRFIRRGLRLVGVDA